MGWRDDLLPASFRGAPFYVSVLSSRFGRRIVEHEYPGRDKIQTEDLGLAAPQIRLSGFVLGPGYIAARDRLLAALTLPGAGLLVHPTLGELSVTARPADVTESTADGGMATFALEFVESGVVEFPTVAADAGQLVEAAADDVNAAASAAFVSSFATAGSPSFVADAAALSLSSELAAARAAMLAPGVTMSDAIVDAVAELDAIVYQGAAILDTPAALALQLQAAFALAADIDVLDLITAAAGAVAAVVGTVAGQQIADNAAAMSRLFVAAALTAQARIALDVAWDNYTDAAAFRDRFVERADRAAAAGDDAEFVALRDLAGAVADDIEARAASLAQLVTEPIASPVSAFELAQRLYGDGSRADEILARNDSPHAGFLLGDLLVKSQ